MSESMGDYVVDQLLRLDELWQMSFGRPLTKEEAGQYGAKFAADWLRRDRAKHKEEIV